MSKNEEAIRKWIAHHRPDLAWRIDEIIKDQASFALLAIGFEAGADFRDAEIRTHLSKLANDIFNKPENRLEPSRAYKSNVIDEVTLNWPYRK